MDSPFHHTVCFKYIHNIKSYSNIFKIYSKMFPCRPPLMSIPSGHLTLEQRRNVVEIRL